MTRSICPLCKGKGHRWNTGEMVAEAILTLGVCLLLTAVFPPDDRFAKKPCKLCDGEGVVRIRGRI